MAIDQSRFRSKKNVHKTKITDNKSKKLSPHDHFHQKWLENDKKLINGLKKFDSIHKQITAGGSVIGDFLYDVGTFFGATRESLSKSELANGVYMRDVGDSLVNGTYFAPKKGKSILTIKREMKNRYVTDRNGFTERLANKIEKGMQTVPLSYKLAEMNNKLDKVTAKSL